MGFFLQQKGISASSTSVSVVPCCWGSFYPVSRSLSEVIVPQVVVNLLCPWDEVNSESSYATIFTAIPSANVLSEISLSARSSNKQTQTATATTTENDPCADWLCVRNSPQLGQPCSEPGDQPEVEASGLLRTF